MAALGTLLITGGTGTFGYAFTKRILSDKLADKVIILSRDEYKQAQMAERFDQDPRLRFFLGDVRDRDQLHRAFAGVDVIAHAAAYKRIDRSALDILAFLAVNVVGTANVIDMANARDVKKVCFLSSDKACSSSTPYGACKSLAEWLSVNANVLSPTRIVTTRYGNILDSRGSLLEVWRKQAEAGKALVITDRRMSRFWMTIEEAVDLVLLALERGRGGEVFIPKDVGRGKVVDLLDEHYPDTQVVETGKRAYEKLTEELVSPEEVDRLVDCGDCYVLLPHPSLVRWSPRPYGMEDGEGVSVPAWFTYRSDG